MVQPEKERRKEDRCRIDNRTSKFIILWPLLASLTYFLVGLWPVIVFQNSFDAIYADLAILLGVLGIAASIFWKKFILRNIMASLALARSTTAIIAAILNEPPLSFPIIARLTAAGVLGVLFFALAMVEIPYLKAMSHEHRR